MLVTIPQDMVVVPPDQSLALLRRQNDVADANIRLLMEARYRLSQAACEWCGHKTQEREVVPGGPGAESERYCAWCGWSEREEGQFLKDYNGWLDSGRPDK